MKQKMIELANELWKIPNMDKNTLIGILNPLETSQQIQEMMDWLQTIDLTSTKITPVLKKAVEIGD